MIFYVFLFLHCVGCALYYVVKQNKVWIPPCDFDFNQFEIYNESDDYLLYKYATVFYYAMILYGINDASVYALIERFYVAYICIISGIYNAIFY